MVNPRELLLNTSMKIFVNGEAKEVQSRLRLTDLLKEYSLPEERIAVELNKEVVRKKDWAFVEITDSDKIEIVHFVGGG